MKAIFIALCFCFSTYMVLAVLAQQIYGDQIDINIFENIK